MQHSNERTHGRRDEDEIADHPPTAERSQRITRVGRKRVGPTSLKAHGKGGFGAADNVKPTESQRRTQRGQHIDDGGPANRCNVTAELLALITGHTFILSELDHFWGGEPPNEYPHRAGRCN